MESIVHLDTHVAVWLYSGNLDLFNKSVLKLINEHPVCISQIVKLELKFLYEIGRLRHLPDVIINTLIEETGLVYSYNSFDCIINKAVGMDFTHDTFDRIIVADASLTNSFLISKDQMILDNYKYAVWE